MADQRVVAEFIVRGRRAVDGINKILKRTEKLEKALSSLDNNVEDIGKSRAFDKFSKNYVQNSKKLEAQNKRAIKSIQEFGRGVGTLSVAEAQLGAAIADTNDRMVKQSKSMEDAQKLVKRFGTAANKANRDATNNLANSTQAIEANRKADAARAVQLIRTTQALSGARTEQRRGIETLNEATRSEQLLARAADRKTKAFGDQEKATKELTKAHQNKTKAIGGQSDALRRDRNMLNEFAQDLRDNRRAVEQWAAIFQEATQFSFFRAGVAAGVKFFEVWTLISTLVPMLSVALGGIVQTINALAVGAVTTAASLGRLAGVLGALPGLIAAGGVGFLGAKSIFSNIIKPATEGAKELEELQKKINAARSSVATASSDSARISAQNKLNDLLAQQSELMAKTPAGGEALNKQLEQTKKLWRDIWQGGGRAEIAMARASEVLQALQNFMVATQPAVVAIFGAIDRVTQGIIATLNNKAFQNFINDALMLAVENFERLWTLAQNLGPRLGDMFQIMQMFTATLLSSLNVWARMNNNAATLEEKAAGLQAFFERSAVSIQRWVTAMKDFKSALGNIFRAAAPITNLFEQDWTRVMEDFNQWTLRSQGRIQQFFTATYPILRALGGLFKDIFTAFGTVAGTTLAQSGGSSAEFTRSTTIMVQFLRQLGDGLIQLGGFLRTSLLRVGPELMTMFTALGRLLSSISPAIVGASEKVLMIFALAFNTMAKMAEIPGIGHFLSGVIQLRAVLMVLGFLVGNTVVIAFSRLTKIVVGLIQITKLITAGGVAAGIAGVAARLKDFFAIITGGSIAAGTAAGAQKAASGALGKLGVQTVYVVNKLPTDAIPVYIVMRGPRGNAQAGAVAAAAGAGAGAAGTAARQASRGRMIATGIGVAGAAGGGIFLANELGQLLFATSDAADQNDFRQQEIIAEIGALNTSMSARTDTTNRLLSMSLAPTDQMGFRQAVRSNRATAADELMARLPAHAAATPAAAAAASGGGLDLTGLFTDYIFDPSDPLDLGLLAAGVLTGGTVFAGVKGFRFLNKLRKGRKKKKKGDDIDDDDVPFEYDVAAASGGIVPGRRKKGDTVPAMLTPGEVILNQRQQQEVGRQNINRALGPQRLAQGGYVQGAIPATDPETAQLAQAAFAKGFNVTSSTRPDSSTFHRTGQALDFGNSVNNLQSVWNWLSPKASALNELLGPYGSYFSGKFSPNVEPGHSDHVHVAFTGSDNVSFGPDGSGESTKRKLDDMLIPQATAVPGTVEDTAVRSQGKSIQKKLQKQANRMIKNFNNKQVDPSGHAEAPSPGQGVTPSNVSSSSASANRILGQSMAAAPPYSWTGAEWSALDELWGVHESGWESGSASQNPTSSAFGIPQALVDMHGLEGTDYMTSPRAQIAWGLDYIKGKYGSPSAADNFWHNIAPTLSAGGGSNWYGAGGDFVASGPQMIGVGEKGPERVSIQPLAGAGANRPRGPQGGGDGSTSISSNISVGVLVGDQKGLEKLSEMVGEQILTDLRKAQRTRARTPGA